MVQGAAWEPKRGAATDLRQEQAHTYREPTVRGPNKPEPHLQPGSIRYAQTIDLGREKRNPIVQEYDFKI